MKKLISKKENLIILVLTVIVIAIGASFFVYAHSRKHQMSETQQSENNFATQTSAVPILTTSTDQDGSSTHPTQNAASSAKVTQKDSAPSSSDDGMSTYTSTQYGLSFRYPANMTCTETHRFINGTAQIESNMVGGNSGSAAVEKYAAGIADVNLQGTANGEITCGNMSLNGSEADNAGGTLGLMSDNGTSLRRTTLQSTILPDQTVTIGSNTFYKVPNMPNYLVIFEPTYMLEVTGISKLIPPDHIDLGSLKFQ